MENNEEVVGGSTIVVCIEEMIGTLLTVLGFSRERQVCAHACVHACRPVRMV